ncbi:tonB-dependent Receptor Plug domain protein, partial [Yersinia pestis PY-63]
MGIIEWL